MIKEKNKYIFLNILPAEFFIYIFYFQVTTAPFEIFNCCTFTANWYTLAGKICSIINSADFGTRKQF